MKLDKIRIIRTMLLIVVICFLSSSKSVFAAQTKSYDISKGNITIDKSGDYTITGKTDKNTITIKKGVSTNITLRDIEISITAASNIPILIEGGGAANFILEGESKITSQWDEGIRVKSGGKFIVSSNSTGSLEVTGGIADAGIGGSGTIIIKGGTIKAKGGQYGYGIGSGYAYQPYQEYDGEAGSITITGGNVTAIGGKDASGGIGFSSKKSTGIIEITGGTVYSTSGGSGIGDHAFECKGNKITISGGNVTAIAGAYGAGIGSSLNPNGTSVVISGGTIKADGGMGTDVYDSWSYSNDNRLRQSRQEYDIAAMSITITGGQIFADYCSVQPQNSQGQKLYLTLIPSETGKVTKITAYQKSYGSKDINSKGILSLWLPRLNSEDGKLALDVTFASGKHTKKDYLSSFDVLQGYSSSKDMVFNLSVSNLEVYADGLIYKNKIYRRNSYSIKITGSTSKNQIIVHGGKHSFEFENVTVDYTKQTDKMFFVVSGESDVLINSKKQNSIKTGGNSVGLYVGTNAKLSFAGSSNEDKLTIETFDDSYGIATPSGSIQQFGGNISITAKQNSIGIYLGNAGAFSLYNGIINGISSTQNAIYGLNYMKVNVYGGIMNMDNIGYRDESNEEVTDKSCFTISNGEINISNRMIFNTFEVTGGNINAHLLGSGIGSRIFMYQGKIVMDKFITDTTEPEYNEESNDYVIFEYITADGVSKKSALDTSTIYGGVIEETHNVTIEELKKISFGSC
ncbi:MAG TPA: hypothetical protein DHW61_15890 [Lachnoclostridium phytofermentans]|uniref:Carbohydrate-binding domain-containing protein n=1 Tax=Lachnoclostridium phytofermentans TaxID=66219 RepID=A0A3D2X9R3_9FIRM|nr:hypothetical protein [Lachnoclostridium sp.]HCL03862.1 hypothetical protein [Lachnoclostridium phytofermentans]